jgi:hypothetical protein
MVSCASWIGAPRIVATPGLLRVCDLRAGRLSRPIGHGFGLGLFKKVSHRPCHFVRSLRARQRSRFLGCLKSCPLPGLVRNKGLVAPRVAWTNRRQETATLDDLRIVAPYNPQVPAIAERIPRARVGTVDKSQGQEAPRCLHPHVEPSGRASWHGVLIQPAPAERCDLPSPEHLDFRRRPPAVRTRILSAGAEADGERGLSVP